VAIQDNIRVRRVISTEFETIILCDFLNSTALPLISTEDFLSSTEHFIAISYDFLNRTTIFHYI